MPTLTTACSGTLQTWYRCGRRLVPFRRDHRNGAGPIASHSATAAVTTPPSASPPHRLQPPNSMASAPLPACAWSRGWVWRPLRAAELRAVSKAPRCTGSDLLELVTGRGLWGRRHAPASECRRASACRQNTRLYVGSSKQGNGRAGEAVRFQGHQAWPHDWEQITPALLAGEDCHKLPMVHDKCTLLVKAGRLSCISSRCTTWDASRCRASAASTQAATP